MKPQSAGGKVMAKRQRTEALSNYYKNPNFCKSCDKMINVRENERVSDAKNRKFCTRSCGASYTNKLRKRKKAPTKQCLCGSPISRRAAKCMKCHGENMASVYALTKGELMAKSKYWIQYRTVIGKDARKVYKNSGREYVCKICGYDTHVDIGHIKDVKDFPDSATVREINNVNNLVPLCPNHHWEFDHGLLKIAAMGVEPSAELFRYLIPGSLLRSNALFSIATDS